MKTELRVNFVCVDKPPSPSFLKYKKKNKNKTISTCKKYINTRDLDKTLETQHSKNIYSKNHLMVLYSVMEQQQTFRTRNFSPQELGQPMLCHVPRQPQHQTQGESNQSFQTGTDHCRSIPISSEASAGK